MPADHSEQLRQVGLWCASTITCHLDAWRSTAQWLIKLPLCQAIETTDDAHHPNLRDGRWIVDPRSPEYHRFYLYDNHVEEERIFGPNCRRLSNGWQEASYRFRQRPEDCYIDFGIDDAKRFVLLAALLLNRDFDGAALGLGWPWVQLEGCDATFEGRGAAWMKITTNVREEALLLELIKMAKMAIDYLEALPSMWKTDQADDWVEIRRVIGLLNVSASTVRADCKSGELPSKRKGMKPKSPYLVRRLDCMKRYGK